MSILFGKFAKWKRIEAKLSQDDVAKAMGFQHRSEISRKEAGKIEWKLSEIVILAHLLNVKPSELMAEFENVL